MNVDKQEEYKYWFNELLKVVKENKTIKYDDFTKYGLPSSRWFLKYCQNKDVENYNDFLEKELKIKVNYKISKQSAKDLIYDMVNEYKRPLKYDDFTGSNKKLNICTVKKYWGTMNNMKKELGLEIVQEDMISKSKTKEELLNDIEKLIKDLGRLPSISDIDSCNYTGCSSNYSKYFGGINNVFIQLGYLPNKKSISLNLTNHDIVEMYKEFIKDNGIVPSHAYASNNFTLPSPTTVMRRFNCTWNEFIISLGYEANNVAYNKTYAKDGTLCNSVGEAIVHNYLSNLEVDNLNKEIYYKDILEDKNLRKEAGFRRLDWTFDYNNETYYVEYFGMMGYKEYNKTHDLKIDLITRDKKIDNFIAIYPKDLKYLHDLIKNKLK